MVRAENISKWCLEQGKKGGKKHKGLKKIKPDVKEAEKHIEKALHNLRAMEYNIKGGYTDWAASAAFYAMYHVLLALLYKMGYESRNQECTISTVEYFIAYGKIKLIEEDIKKIRDAQSLESEDAKSLREDMQYGTKTKLEEEKLKKLSADAKYLVNKVRIILEEI